MNKKLIIFDLDGVLVDSKNIHFDALNYALNKIDSNLIITKQEQENIYEGLPTQVKLNILTEQKNLHISLHQKVWEDKQIHTLKLLNELTIDQDLIAYLKLIKHNNIKIAVASNSIKKTIDLCLSKLGISNLIDLVISNEDVKYPKPHPEMYWKAMSYFGMIAEETVIFEDSIVGKIAAKDSKANLIEILNRKDLSLDKIKLAINLLNNNKFSWNGSNINIVIPMAGIGKRFQDAGYAFPKPLIEVHGKPMIQSVVENLAINGKYIYIVQDEHYSKYNLEQLLNLITPGCDIVRVNGITDGAAITCLLAEKFINSDEPLIIANSDQLVEWNSKDFIYQMMIKNVDGGIATFKSTHPKWSYVKTNSFGYVEEVAEKKPISNIATVGIYFWKHGSDYIKYAKQMIKKDIKTNGEFYVCPVFNEAIMDNKRVYTYPVSKMYGIGTPEDLNYYLSKESNND